MKKLIELALQIDKTLQVEEETIVKLSQIVTIQMPTTTTHEHVSNDIRSSANTDINNRNA